MFAFLLSIGFVSSISYGGILVGGWVQWMIVFFAADVCIVLLFWFLNWGGENWVKKVKEGGKGVRLCLLGFYFYLDIHLPSYKYLDVNFVKEHLVRCCDSGRSSVFLYVIHRPWWIFGFECFVGCFDYSGWFVFYFGGFFLFTCFFLYLFLSLL